MKRSFLYRVIAKAQTVFVRKLMKMSLSPSYLDEDVHLQNYAPSQCEAEKKLSEYQNKFQELSPMTLQEKHRLLVVIPFRDKWMMTERCIQGVLRQKHDHLEILIALVDNGSIEVATQEGIRDIQIELKAKGIQSRYLRYDTPFNFSYLNNQAVKDCADFNADVFGLLNNDIEFIDDDSIMKLVEASFLPQAGAVGCTLLYPNGKVQHLFVFVGSKIVGSHPYKGGDLHLDAHWYEKPRAVGAVTGAVLFVQSKHYNTAGGFDELLPTSYQDVDLCLKFQKMGLTNWVLPRVLLIHHETQTRSHEPSWGEAAYIEKKWGSFLVKNPFVSSVWSRKSEHFVLKPLSFLRLFFLRGA